MESAYACVGAGEEERRGVCLPSERAFCPPPCDSAKYDMHLATSSALSSASIGLLASQVISCRGRDEETSCCVIQG